jgi:hypothetical protein
MRFLFFMTAFFILLAAPAVAQEQNLYQQYKERYQELQENGLYDSTIKDSFYFMRDDGEFSDEEKDEEAIYVYQKCRLNMIQSTYYDCGCIAGRFRQMREGPLRPQGIILSEIFNFDDEKSCADTVNIAGQAYSQCLTFAKIYRSRDSEAEIENYCTCVGNTTAKNFSMNPQLDINYAGEIRTEAMLACGNQL